MIRVSGQSKSRPVKAAGAEVAVQQRMKNCTPLWREAHFQVKMLKIVGPGRTFWKVGCGKILHAVARSTF